MRTDRIGNAGLNTAIVVLGVVMIVLVWSLVGGWGRGSAAGTGGEHHDIVQLDVRNGCGETGLAARLADYLRGRGMDVIEEGDWTRFGVDETFVVDRIGDGAPARAVLQALGIDEDRMRTDVLADYYLDATLVIGCDYASLPPFREDD